MMKIFLSEYNINDEIETDINNILRYLLTLDCKDNANELLNYIALKIQMIGK